jgi:hypothetical protein
LHSVFIYPISGIKEDINHAVCSSLLLSLIYRTLFQHPEFVPYSLK